MSSNDTSTQFRDAKGNLKAPITVQASDRTPDWLGTLADVVGVMLDGWNGAVVGGLEDAAKPTNNVLRSRAALVDAVKAHTELHMKETWRPAVTLGDGETMQKDVTCTHDWNDMYDREAAQKATEALAEKDDVWGSSFESPSPGRGTTPMAEAPVAVSDPVPLGTEGLEHLSMSALSDIGNQVEETLRKETIKRMAAGAGAIYSSV